jgi:hypothetical protein
VRGEMAWSSLRGVRGGEVTDGITATGRGTGSQRRWGASSFIFMARMKRRLSRVPIEDARNPLHLPERCSIRMVPDVDPVWRCGRSSIRTAKYNVPYGFPGCRCGQSKSNPVARVSSWLSLFSHWCLLFLV